MAEIACCLIGCSEKATVEICGPKGIEECVYTCRHHVGNMMKEGDITYALEPDPVDIQILEDNECQNEECKEARAYSVSMEVVLDKYTIASSVSFVCEKHIDSARQELIMFNGEPDGESSHMFLTELF